MQYISKRAYHLIGVSRICGLTDTENTEQLRTKSENRYQGVKICETKCTMCTAPCDLYVYKAEKDEETELIELLYCLLLIKNEAVE